MDNFAGNAEAKFRQFLAVAWSDLALVGWLWSAHGEDRTCPIITEVGYSPGVQEMQSSLLSGSQLVSSWTLHPAVVKKKNLSWLGTE